MISSRFEEPLPRYPGYQFCRGVTMSASIEENNLNTHPKTLLTHIIKTAKQSGFSFRNFLDNYDSFVITTLNIETGRMVLVLRNEEQLRLVYDSVYTLFFDMDFARALFGESWEGHLVRLAETNDKLKYISENIKISFTHDTTDKKFKVG